MGQAVGLSLCSLLAQVVPSYGHLQILFTYVTVLQMLEEHLSLPRN